MDSRPKIKIEQTTTDKIFEIIGWILVIGVWILTIANYSSLPDTVPIHFNALGEADDFGSKIIVLILPIISTVLFVGLTILNKFPHIFNYPITITQENALRQYTNVTRMMRYLKLVVVFMFGIIVFKIIQNANGQADGLGIWFLPLILVFIFIPITYFVVKSFRIR